MTDQKTAAPYKEWQDEGGRMVQNGAESKAPLYVYADADYEEGDGSYGLHETVKRANEPAIQYRRADLAPMVKPLEWVDENTYGRGQWGNGVFNYQIRCDPGVNHWRWRRVGDNLWHYGEKGQPPLTKDQAKAAAQADYERRILSALTHAPMVTVQLPAEMSAKAVISALKDIECGRGMFGVDGSEDAMWAMNRTGAALKAIAEDE